MLSRLRQHRWVALFAIVGVLMAGGGWLASRGWDEGPDYPNLVPIGEDQALREGLSAVRVPGFPDRRYAIYVPPGDGRRPMILDLHGAGGSSSKELVWSDLDRLGRRVNAVVVFAEAVQYPSFRGVQAGGWWDTPPCSFGDICWSPATRGGVDDLGYLRAVIQDVRRRLPIDPTRSYLYGASNGGQMATDLACASADLFVAVVIDEGTMEADPCTPSRPLRVLLMGAADSAIVPYTGNESYRSPFDSLDRWRRALGCADGVTEGETPIAEIHKATSCPTGSAASLVLVPTGGHDWHAHASFDWQRSMWDVLDGDQPEVAFG
jgi:polyhydroxybutyrate depolymerase